MISFVIPAYNEEKTLEEIVRKVLGLRLSNDIKKEVIIVNDGSKDNTLKIAQDLSRRYPEVRAEDNPANMGKTQTVRRGILVSKGEYVVVQDADLEYEPNDIVEMMDLMLDKDLDVVYGNRFGIKNKVIYLQNYVGNKFLSMVSNLFTYPRIRVWIPDMEVCYKLIKGEVIREVAKDITATSNFGFEPEVTARLSRYKNNGKHLRFGIVPINYYPRSIAEGKKMKAFQDGMKALKEILKYNLG